MGTSQCFGGVHCFRLHGRIKPRWINYGLCRLGGEIVLGEVRQTKCRVIILLFAIFCRLVCHMNAPGNLCCVCVAWRHYTNLSPSHIAWNSGRDVIAAVHDLQPYVRLTANRLLPHEVMGSLSSAVINSVRNSSYPECPTDIVGLLTFRGNTAICLSAKWVH